MKVSVVLAPVTTLNEVPSVSDTVFTNVADALTPLTYVIAEPSVNEIDLTNVSVVLAPVATLNAVPVVNDTDLTNAAEALTPVAIVMAEPSVKETVFKNVCDEPTPLT